MHLRKMVYFFMVLLGFGLGMITASILNLMFPVVKERDYTDEEIISRAKDMGMIELKSINKYKEEPDKDNRIKEQENMEENEIFFFQIVKGESTDTIINHLFEEGIIKDREAFKTLVTERKVERKFKFGNYEINKDMKDEELILLLTTD